MTTEHLIDLLSFDPSIEDAKILSQRECGENATLIIAELTIGDDETMVVPLIHYTGEDWLFTPTDWQIWTQATAEAIDIADTDWRVNDTTTKGVIIAGLPRLSPWTPDPAVVKSEVRKAVGEQIRKARTAQGLTTRQLAEGCGLSHSHIVRIESGRYAVTVDTVGQIAAALGIEIVIG